MSIPDLTTLRARMRFPTERKFLSKAAPSAASAGRLSSLWASAGGDVGATPSTAAVPDRTTLGALGQVNGGSPALRMLYAQALQSAGGATPRPSTVLIADRLSHQGGLSGTVTTAQTTNLPTAALTRYTTAKNVQAALEIYSTIGTTQTTVSVSYTNDAGTSGRTSPDMLFGGTGFREASRLIPIPLAAGDTGIKSVESVTVLASTGTAGSFGVTLYRIINVIPYAQVERLLLASPLHHAGGFGLEEVLDDACIFFIMSGDGSPPGPIGGMLNFSED